MAYQAVSDIAELTLSPASGLVSAGGSVSVSLEFDCHSAAEHTGAITVTGGGITLDAVSVTSEGGATTVSSENFTGTVSTQSVSVVVECADATGNQQDPQVDPPPETGGLFGPAIEIQGIYGSPYPLGDLDGDSLDDLLFLFVTPTFFTDERNSIYLFPSANLAMADGLDGAVDRRLEDSFLDTSQYHGEAGFYELPSGDRADERSEKEVKTIVPLGDIDGDGSNEIAAVAQAAYRPGFGTAARLGILSLEGLKAADSVDDGTQPNEVLLSVREAWQQAASWTLFKGHDGRVDEFSLSDRSGNDFEISGLEASDFDGDGRHEVVLHAHWDDQVVDPRKKRRKGRLTYLISSASLDVADVADGVEDGIVNPEKAVAVGVAWKFQREEVGSWSRLERWTPFVAQLGSKNKV